MTTTLFRLPMHVNALHGVTGIGIEDLREFGRSMNVGDEWPVAAVAALAAALELDLVDHPTVPQSLPVPIVVGRRPTNKRFIFVWSGESKVTVRVTPIHQKKFRPGMVLDAAHFAPDLGPDGFWRWIGPYPPRAVPRAPAPLDSPAPPVDAQPIVPE